MEEILALDLPPGSDVLGVIRGITLGVTENTPEGFKDAFRFTGTMHLFAVSGLHVGMLAVIIWFALRALRLPQRVAIGVTIPALFFYVLVTGMKMGSIRSAVMASILLCGLLLYRRSPLINTLAAAAVFQLAWDPNALFSAGWQFSYSVVFAILLFAEPLEHWIESWCSRDPFLPPQLLSPGERIGFASWRHFSGLAAVSAAAWIGALIPTLAYFHLISFSAFGANLLAVPLAFGVLSLGAISLLFGTFSPWISGAFNNANWLLAKLLLMIVQTSAILPCNHWFVGPPASPEPMMTLLDLRGGSCAVIRDENQFALIDAGEKRNAYAEILPYLESLGANAIHSCLVTKSDAAHLGGLPVLRKEIPITQLLLGGEPTRSVVANDILSSVSTECLPPWRETLLTKHVSAEVLIGHDVRSRLVRISLGHLRILILPEGDSAFLKLISDIPDQELRADLLIMPLGDAEFASTLAFLGKVSTKAVITPVQPFRRNGVPSNEWKHLLGSMGISLFRQDECGAISMMPQQNSSQRMLLPFLKDFSSGKTWPDQ
jgi:ComEC/Rec2-related protein